MPILKSRDSREKVVNAHFRMSTKSNKNTFLFKAKVLVICAIVLLVLFGLFMTYREINQQNKWGQQLGDDSLIGQVVDFQTKDEVEKLIITVNSERELPRTYKLDLVAFNQIQCDKMLVEDLSKMISDAKSNGCNLKVSRGYVSSETQDKMYNDKVLELINNQGYTKVKAESEAQKYIQKGNRSEYQTGLIIDIKADDENFLTSKEYAWLLKHSVDYGFVLRYPQNKEIETGLVFNPNAYRYVGIENAKNMRAKDMCLEEYSYYISLQK